MSSALRKILVVDEDPETARTVRAALPHEGYTVVPTTDAASALKALSEQNLDALVSELTLPDGNGLHLLIEARLVHPLVPRLVVSGVEDFASAVSAINEAEVFRFLRKPLDTPSLRAAIEDALGRAESLYQVKGVREEAERRRLALADLETDHPGITMVSLGPEGYTLAPPRLRALQETLKDTPLGPHLAAALELPGPDGSG